MLDGVRYRSMAPENLITLAHFSVLLGDELSEVGGRAGKHRAAQIGKPRLQIGIGEASI